MSDTHTDSATSESALLADTLRLAMVSGVGPRLRYALLECFGTPADVLAAAPSDLQSVPGIGSKIARQIALARDEIDVEAELDLCRKHQIELLTE